MTIKEFYEKYGDVELTEEQEKHIKEYLKIKESKRYIPKMGESYYIVTTKLTVGEVFYTSSQNELDNVRLFTNNCFKTKEEAEFRLEQIKVYNELKNFADENNKEIDLNDFKLEKHIIQYDLENEELYCDWYATAKSIGQIYFSSKELAEQAIEKVGADRIKKYLFGVE